MAAKKKTEKIVSTKAYTLRGLLVAKARGSLPKGVKVHVVTHLETGDPATICFRKGNVTLAQYTAESVVNDWIVRLGFTKAK